MNDNHFLLNRWLFRCGLLLFAFLLFPASAFAQSPCGDLLDGSCVVDEQREGAFGAQRFFPAPGPRNFLTVRTARSDGERTFSLGAMVNYAHEPIIVELAPNVCRDRRDCNTRVIQNLAVLDLMGTYTPVPNVQIGLRVPVAYVQGQGITETGEPAALTGAGVDTVGLADPELEGKFRFYGAVDSPIAVGAAVFVTAPLGELTAEGNFLGSSSVTAGGRLIVDGRSGLFSYGVNLGGRYQESARIVADLGSEMFFGAAGALEVGPIFDLLAEIRGTTRFSGGAGTNTAELNAAARINPLNSPWAVTLGAGPGLIQGAIGVPTVRAFVGLSYTHEVRDTDGDGIPDAVDMCPTEPEDMDGFEDADGCPDADNDGDGIADDLDRCPNQAEDLDGFEDSDGCPDLDNDQDGVPDLRDRCPLEPENINGFEDEDGCPDVKDSDGDGVPDHLDQCPNEPEDTDGFEDTDGCPDPDNDGDGILDERDECVDEPEDFDGVEDEDGCPEDD